MDHQLDGADDPHRDLVLLSRGILAVVPSITVAVLRWVAVCAS
jgi:hypothetical protein